jgi:GT2 family glycosyltransferase
MVFLGYHCAGYKYDPDCENKDDIDHNMTQYKPSASVILPTFKREASLCETIAQLLQQDYWDFELIIVDQTPQHETNTDEFLRNHADQLRYFKLEQPGLPGARNFGVEKARGEIVLFIDDDVKIQPDWIATHVSNFSEPQIGGVSGRVIEEGQPVVNTTNVLRVSRCGRIIGNRTSTLRTKVEWASGGNSSFRKDLVKKAGGFDIAFQGNAIFEDVDFSFRLRRLGYEIVFDPKAVIIHLAEKQGGCQTRTADRVNYYYWFIRNKTLFFLKNYPLVYVYFLQLANIIRAVKIGLIEVHNWKDFIFLLQASKDAYLIHKKNQDKCSICAY